MNSLCTWCGVETPEEFCSEACRESFSAACRIWAEEQYGCGELSIFELRTCLGRRAHRAERGPSSQGAKAAEPETRTDGTLRVAAPVMDEQRSPPDMTDMFVAGLPLREAVAIRRAIEREPDKPAEHWWNLVSASAHSVQGTC